jgi:hypothetical protein
MEYLEDALGTVIAVLPKVLLFLVILVVGWIIARVLRKVVAKLLDRVGVDRAIERGGLRRWMGTMSAGQLIARLVYYAVLLFTLQFAFNVFGPNPVSDLINAVVAFLPRAFVALLIVVIAAAIAAAVKDVITSSLGGLSYGRLLATLAQVFILALGVIAALNQIGVATTVTTPVLIAVLATVGGVIVVGVGGGLVHPMRQRWERWLTRGEAEMGNIRTQMQASRQNRDTTTSATTPQHAYTGQGVGAAVDPSHPRYAQPPHADEQPTVAMPQPGTSQPGMAQPPSGGSTTYRGGSSGTP